MHTRFIAIIGFGNQAKAWAHNLRDSAWDVTILLRKGSESWQKAQDMGFNVGDLAHISNHSTLVLLIPDHHMPAFFAENTLAKDSLLLFAHGSMPLYHAEVLPKDINFGLLSPKMIADEVRQSYKKKQPLPCVIDVISAKDPEPIGKLITDIAKALGCEKKYLLEYSIETEVHADFFSEQALLCGGVPKLLMLSVETMVKYGIPKDLAFYECVKELEIFMRLFNTKGFYATMQGISPSAMYGSARFTQDLMPKDLQKNLDVCMKNIKSGAFYKDLQKASLSGLKASTLWKEDMKKSLLNEVCIDMLAQEDTKDS